MSSSTNHDVYFIPEPSKWPVVGTIALTTSVIGAVTSIHAGSVNLILPVGLLMIAYLFFGWFGAVIKESMSDSYNAQVDKSFRIGMLWFIFSEVMFFVGWFMLGEVIGPTQWLACLLITLAILMTPARATRNLTTQMVMPSAAQKKEAANKRLSDTWF